MNIKFVIGICFLISAIFVGYGLMCENQVSPDTYAKKYRETVNELRQNTDLDIVRVFEMRYAYYKEDLKSFQNIQLQILIILITSLLVIFFKTEKITIPILSLSLPSGIIFLVSYLGGLYLWVNYGLTLNSLIDSRMSLHYIVKEIQSTSPKIEIGYEHSLEHILADSSMIDNWFSHFFNIFEGNDISGLKRFSIDIIEILGLYGIYGIVIGLFLATLIAITFEFVSRKKLPKYVGIAMLTFLFAMIILSFLVFVFKMPYVTYWLAAIWGFAGFNLVVWVWKGQNLVKEINKPKTPGY